MGATPSFAIPYIEPSDLLANYPAADKVQAERLEAILAATGWTNITPNGGGSIRWRKLGALVIIQLDMPVTTVSGSIYTFSAVPGPPEIRPIGYTARGYADYSGFPGGLGIGTDGVITGRHQRGANCANTAGSLVYVP
jgi:hypothetical protein